MAACAIRQVVNASNRPSGFMAASVGRARLSMCASMADGQAVIARRRPDSSALKVTASPSSSAITAVRLPRSEEHTSELQSLMRISYAVFCLKKKKKQKQKKHQASTIITQQVSQKD